MEKGLLPVYLVSGDEPLQSGEAVDAIRGAARARGFTERQVMHAEGGFDWNSLLAASDTLSLFAERRIIELRLPGGKPGDAGAKALTAYVERPSPDDLLIIVSGKLDKRQQQSKWFKALDSIGAVIQIWPVEREALPAWIRQRLLARGLQADPDAVALLAERVEGNLLAAAQEVEKLYLLHGQGRIGAAEVGEMVADSARFDIFGLVDAALEGNAERFVRMLQGLRGEGVEPVLVLWALARELRSLANMAWGLSKGEAMEQVLRSHRVWDKRRAAVSAALRRHRGPSRWDRLVARAARIDRIIKGSEPGNAWDELIQLGLLAAGVRVV